MAKRAASQRSLNSRVNTHISRHLFPSAAAPVAKSSLPLQRAKKPDKLLHAKSVNSAKLINLTVLIVGGIVIDVIL